jgi:hypothetical protein
MQELAPAPRLAARVAAVANRRFTRLTPPFSAAFAPRVAKAAFLLRLEARGRAGDAPPVIPPASFTSLRLSWCRLPPRKKKPPGNIPAASEENPTVQLF